MTDTLAGGLRWLASYLRWRGYTGVWLLLRHRLQNRWGRGAFTVSDPELGRVKLRRRSTDLRVFHQIIIMHEYEDPPRQRQMLQNRYEALLAAGEVPLIIDAGANIGLFARSIALRFPAARVIGIEPDPDNLALARANCADLDRVEIRHGALWHREGNVEIVNPEAESWAFAVGEASGGANRVPAFPVDRIVADHPDASLLLIKLDIEGAERTALPLDAAFWKQRPVIYIEPHDNLPGQTGSLRGLIGQSAYRDADIIVRGENLLIYPKAKSAAP